MTVKYDEAKIREAIKDSRTMSEAVCKSGLASMTFRRIAKKLNLYAPNQSRKGILGRSGRGGNPGFSLEEIFKLQRKYNGQRLKALLIQAGLKTDVCEICDQLPEWNGKRLVLQLDHINGKNSDNRLENLRVICGHCHSQTETFAGRNVQSQRVKRES